MPTRRFTAASSPAVSCLIGCPKLDDVDYSEKAHRDSARQLHPFGHDRAHGGPLRGGLEMAAKRALQQSGKFLPWHVVTVHIDGSITED